MAETTDGFALVITNHGFEIVTESPVRTFHCETRPKEGSGRMAIFVEGIDGSFSSVDEAAEAIRRHIDERAGLVQQEQPMQFAADYGFRFDFGRTKAQLKRAIREKANG